MSNLGDIRRGPPVGRHLAAVGLTGLLVLVFMWVGGNPDDVRPFHIGQETFAATSLVLLCLILVLGPAARLLPRLRPIVPWGRELGIAMFVTAGLHVALLTEFTLNVSGFFGHRPWGGDFEFYKNMWASSNWIGAVALGYALVLAATSNDWAQRRLGRGWKFLQRQAYTLFVLAWLHTAAFVVIGAGHGAILPGWLFWAVTSAVVVAQSVGFVVTIRSPRGPSPHRVPPRAARNESARADTVMRWAGVVTLWALVVGGSWATTQFDSEEDRQVDRLCERWIEVRGSPMSDIRDELLSLLPDDFEAGDLNETLRVECSE